MEYLKAMWQIIKDITKDPQYYAAVWIYAMFPIALLICWIKSGCQIP